MTTMVLPELRDELALYPGPTAYDGGPTWTLQDPLSNRFFRLSWPAFEVLSRWHLNDPQAIAQAVTAETVLEMQPEDVLGVVDFLARSQLLKVTANDIGRLLAIHEAGRTSWFNWLLHHYLFFRLPLVRPDAMLDRVLPYVSWLGSKPFFLVTLVALLVGVFFIGRQWDLFTATFVDHFSFTGMVAFGIALGLAKIIHELGHAFTAKAYGCRIPTMGVAFLVLWPMLYTDANEAWKLTSRRQRLLVSGAGILSELTLAAWATLAWGVLPDGSLKAMAFTLAATTWISSLLINLSPFMRFDGYFLAMDALEQPNLHPRSFALARWHLRETLFALGEPVPEYLRSRTRTAMIAFAWVVWLYRLILFLGIAVLVYHFFIKAVAIVLFAVEIGWFVIKPIISEMGEWRKRASVIRTRGRARISLLILGVVVVLCVVPWNSRVTAPALLKADEHRLVYAPSAAILKSVLVTEGQVVKAGTILAILENPDMTQRLVQLEQQIQVLKYQLSVIAFEDSFRARSQALAEELAGVIAEKTALTNETKRLILSAPIDGMVVDISPFVQTGQWLNSQESILGLRQGIVLEAYVAEEDVPRLRLGVSAIFIPEGTGSSRKARCSSIDRSAVKALLEPSLTTLYGGDIPARFADKALVPDGAYYRVRLALDDPAVTITTPLRGRVRLNGERRSLLAAAWQSVAAVFIREWGM